MKKLMPLIAAGLALVACGETADPAQQFRDALPKSEAVQIGTPDSEQASGAALSVEGRALGGSRTLQSEYAVMSYYLALTMNTGVGSTLGFLHFVTRFPPTTCDETSCTWGPWVDSDGLNRWKLDVLKNGEAYEYALSAQPGTNASAPFVDLITGTAYPADRDRGRGTFTIDFDAQAALDHGPLWEQKDFGELAVTYDNTAAVSIDAVFTDARNDDPANAHPMNAVYSFSESSSGGVLQIAFENLDTAEVVSLRTRWSPSGAGRADAHYSGPGEGAPIDYYASECWAGKAQGFVEVYDSKHPEIEALQDENACSPFSSAQYADVVLP